MGLLSKIGGMLVGGGISKTAEGITKAINQFVETPDEKRAAEMLIAKMRQESQKWQAEINKVEAGHRSLFIAGWRPAVGWICVLALFWGWILAPLLLFFYPERTLPAIEIGQTISLIMALLGVAGLRTWEKKEGVSG